MPKQLRGRMRTIASKLYWEIRRIGIGSRVGSRWTIRRVEGKDRLASDSMPHCARSRTGGIAVELQVCEVQVRRS